jgi:hypothetical protein
MGAVVGVGGTVAIGGAAAGIDGSGGTAGGAAGTAGTSEDAGGAEGAPEEAGGTDGAEGEVPGGEGAAGGGVWAHSGHDAAPYAKPMAMDQPCFSLPRNGDTASASVFTP